MVGRPTRSAGERSAAAMLLGLLWPCLTAALGGETGPGEVSATRTPRPPRIDGRLDDAVWRLAEPFDRFVQISPDEGSQPTEPTEVRVLYDDRTLYVGVRCRDSRPGEIVMPMGRRDKPPVSDQVMVILDPAHDRQSGYAFVLTAGGVMQDGVFYDDDRTSWDWDAVWDGRVTVDEQGWSAEFAIPLGIFHLSGTPVQTWGFGVRRELARHREVAATVPIPRNARGVISRLGHLTGVTDLGPGAYFEVVPYLASRLAWRPQYRDPTRPRPRLTDAILDAGLDLRWLPSRGLSLVATLNPDFGQVEADEVIQNLTTYEIRLPEKRPFFNEGLGLFQPVGAGDDDLSLPQQFFYSRRIGLQSPIFGAAKVTARIAETLHLSLLDALLAGGARPSGSSESRPARDLHWAPEQPLHLAPGDAFSDVASVAENRLAGVLRWRPTAEASFGAALASALPLTRDCADGDLARATLLQAPLPARCTAAGGHAAAADWNLHWDDSRWAFYGQLAGSRVAGGPPLRVLPDGVALRPGDQGLGLYAAFRRQGGEPWRFDLLYEYESPRLDLNASGYLRTQNQQGAQAFLRFVRPSLTGSFLVFEVALIGELFFTSDGRGLPREQGLALKAHARHASYTDFGCSAGVRDPVWDVREIAGSGIAYRRPAWAIAECFVSTDYSRPFALDFRGSGGWFLASGPVPRQPFLAGEATAQWRPHVQLETRLTLHLERSHYPARWIASGPTEGSHLFADLDSPVLSVTLRQMLVLTPRLTFQLYGQLFTDWGRYQPRYCGFSEDGKVRTSALVPYASPQCPRTFSVPTADFHHSLLNLNAVLRWEYRSGSSLYAVYTRSQQEPPGGGGAVPASLSPRWGGRTLDAFMLKWSYWFSP